MQKNNRENGNIALVILLIAIVLIAVVAVGVYIHRHDHKTTTAKTASTTTSPTSQSSKTTTQTDVYAGWKSYCDSIYHYCFKYPTAWTIDANTATSLGNTAQTTLLNASKTVEIDYINAFVHDSSPVNFTPVSINKLTSANQDVTIVGGYETVSGSYYSSYQVVDSSMLTTYPLTINQPSQFPNNPSFTDQNTGGNTFNGVLRAKSINTINTSSDAKNWLATSDAKTALLILESFYYQK